MEKKETHLLGSTILAAISILLTGISVKSLWLWYIVPLGLQPLTFAHAMGFAYICSILSFQVPPYHGVKAGLKEETPWYYSGGTSIVVKLCFLFCGWIWHFGM